ncbi:PREDICTED: facilitated trehalose transporter Tret1-like [Nicrophorus vespilloides]|uniref:Facilitated trehalose transporter Tret1-like n=1 Tax=Nicrophorus vespilloides TaxID=110193 RepID=A0ABM1NF27_NICVS|nr:PREDICTED: facilitated trehalose transporter Tret1-like [Nicrophorus vespilloides]
MTWAFPRITLDGLEDSSEIIEINEDQVAWIYSTNLFFVPIGCLVSGFLCKRYGRKRTLQYANIPLAFGWMLFRFSKSLWQIYFGLGMFGFLLGCIETSVIHYTCEISKPKLRGFFVASSTLFFIGGALLEDLLSFCFTWRDVALCNFVFPLAAFNLAILLPESPQYLIEKEDFIEARESLAWFRGWVDAEEVEEEFKEAMKEVKSDNKLNFFAAFSLITFLFLVQSFGGSANSEILKMVDSSLNVVFLKIFVHVLEIVGCLLCAFLVNLIGKRPLTFLTLILSTLCLTSIAVYGYIRTLSESSWIPLTLTLIFLVFSHAGIRILPWMLIGEIFSHERKCLGSALCAAIAYTSSFLSDKLFILTTEYLNLTHVFSFYAAINFVALIILFFVLPETEGKTLVEAGIGERKLSRRESAEDLFQVNLTRDENSYKKFANFDSSI